jgi:hypothetical protein
VIRPHRHFDIGRDSDINLDILRLGLLEPRLGNSYAASTFRYFDTYNVVAFLYLVMTVALALFVRFLERRAPNR